MKRCLLVIRECQVKPKLDTTIHLPEWLKLKSLIILNVGRDVKQLELSNKLMRNINWCNHFGKLSLLTNAEHIHTLWPAIPPQVCITHKRNAHTSSPNDIRRLTAILFIIKDRNQMPANIRVEDVVFTNNTEQQWKCMSFKKMQQHWRHWNRMLRKRHQTRKEHTLHDSIYVKFKNYVRTG